MSAGKVIGILGGMGPLATADLYHKLVLHTDAETDQDHPRVVVDSNTDIPDRTAALLRGGADPTSELQKSAKRLVSVGAELIIMPCNTAHGFYDAVAAAAAGVPVLHMLRLTRDALVSRGVKTAGLLATDGTVETGLYQSAFEQSGIALLTPDAEGQAAVMDAIYNGVKAGDLAPDVSALRRCCEALLSLGAETLILGCTELPPAFELYRLDYPATDPTLELALGALRFAGLKTK